MGTFPPVSKHNFQLQRLAPVLHEVTKAASENKMGLPSLTHVKCISKLSYFLLQIIKKKNEGMESIKLGQVVKFFCLLDTVPCTMFLVLTNPHNIGDLQSCKHLVAEKRVKCSIKQRTNKNNNVDNDNNKNMLRKIKIHFQIYNLN